MNTTVNNQIQMVGGIEKARGIVSGAPVECAYYSLVNNIVIYCQWCEEWFWHNPNTNEYERDFSKSMKFSLSDLRTAIAEHDEQIKCWSCNKYMTKSQHSANDGFCIHCSNEVDL